MKTKTEKQKKAYDSVKSMREIRDSISRDIADMSPAQLKEYFKSERMQSKSAKKKD